MRGTLYNVLNKVDIKNKDGKIIQKEIITLD
jgi:hypothetical protein